MSRGLSNRNHTDRHSPPEFLKYLHSLVIERYYILPIHFLSIIIPARSVLHCVSYKLVFTLPVRSTSEAGIFFLLLFILCASIPSHDSLLYAYDVQKHILW
jgi:hypothetical protein